MSVVGLDVGNASSCVAVARKGGIDVLMNRESKRETPSVVSFSGGKMRSLGTDGAAKMSMHPKATVSQIKRLIGRKFRDPAVQSDIARFAFPVRESDSGGCVIDVNFAGEARSFSPEQLMAMLLVDLMSIVSAEQAATAGLTSTATTTSSSSSAAATPVTKGDCVVAVPAYFTEGERAAMLDGLAVAGITPLRLMNETSATALAYGIFKTELSETEPANVAFVDMGDSSFQVCIVSLTKGKLKILATAWDRDLGGRDFTEVIFEQFAKEFQSKYHLDVKSNAKASFRLRTACEKFKRMLSANAEAHFSVDCLMEDTDFRSHMKRDDFERLAEPLLERLLAPCREAIDMAGIGVEEIKAAEVVGNATRTPAVQRIIEAFFNRSVSRTMNAKECVSRGCALQCAMLSPVFRVREYEIIDLQPYSIILKWEKDGQMTTNMMFEKGSAYPCTKLLTFIRSEPFSITAEYQGDEKLPTSDKTLAEYHIGPIAVPQGEEKAKLKVKVKLNMNGMIDVESVQMIQEEEYEVPLEAPAEKAATGTAATAESVEANGKGPDEAADGSNSAAAETSAPMEAEASPEKKPKVEKKKRTKKTSVPFKSNKFTGLPQTRLNEYFEEEGKMAAADKLQEDTNECKNALETYILGLRNKLHDQLSPYVKEQDRMDLSSKLDAMEDWLYDEGEDQTKSVYVAKLEELQKLGNPIELRYKEEQNRQPSVEALTDMCNVYTAMARSDAQEYAHIDAEKKEQVVKECETALKWLSDKMSFQQQLKKHDDPVLLCNDILKKRDTLERFCKPILTQPPPAPPKEETKQAEPPKDEKSGPCPEPMDVDPEAQETAPAAEPQAGENPPHSPGEPMQE